MTAGVAVLSPQETRGVQRWWTTTSSRARYVAVGVVYLAAWVALDLAATWFQTGPDVSVWHPPSALDVALLLVLGLRYTPWTLLSVIAHQLLVSKHPLPPLNLAAYSLITTLAYAGGVAFLLRIARIDPRLPRLRDVGWFVVAAGLLAPLLVALVQVVNLAAVGKIPWKGVRLYTMQYWAGESTGVLLLAPALLVVLRRVPWVWETVPAATVPPGTTGPPTATAAREAAPALSWVRRAVQAVMQRSTRRAVLVAGAQVAALGLGVWAAYGAERVRDLDYTYLIFPPLIWVAFARGFPGATAAVLGINIGAALMTAGRVAAEHGLALQFGLMAVTATALVLGAVVTERSYVAATRERMASELRRAQKLEAVGRLAAGVAHDFNNLLAVIKSYSQLLGESVPPGPVREDVAEIERAADRGATLTRQLLAVSRRAPVEWTGEQETADLRAVVHDLTPLLARLVTSAVRVDVHLPNEPVPVRGSGVELEQVLMNLSANARDAMPDGGTLTIDVTPAGTPSGRARLCVRDTGTGIDADTLAQLFEPFFTTKAEGQGTGLGLATVRAVVARYGGEVTVDSQVGEGTTVTIVLRPASLDATSKAVPSSQPKAKKSARSAPSTDGAAAGAGKEPTGPPAATASGRVLVVDDEEGVGEGMRRVLDRAGFTAEAATSGADALRRLGELDGEVVLVTDISMPGMSGLELARRASAQWPAMRIVFVSAQAGAPSLPPHTLAKPCSAERLVHAVATACAWSPAEGLSA